MTFITEDACKYVTDIILRNNYNAINGAVILALVKCCKTLSECSILKYLQCLNAVVTPKNLLMTLF